MSIDVLKDRLPEYARDLKLNLSSLASEQLLTPQQKAGSFIAAALAADQHALGSDGVGLRVARCHRHAGPPVTKTAWSLARMS